MTKFHSDDYIRFLRSIRPDNMTEYNKQMQRCKLILCPNGMYFRCADSLLELQSTLEKTVRYSMDYTSSVNCPLVAR